MLSKMFSFTSEEQRLAYLDIFRPYGLFPFLKGTETDLATAVLRYKGVVLDSIVEDRLLAEATRRSQERLILDKGELELLFKRELELLLHPARKLSAETNQRIEALKAEVTKIVVHNLLVGASQGSEDQMDQLNSDQRELELLLQPAQKLSAETNQRIEMLEAEIKKIESHLRPENVFDLEANQGSQEQKPLEQLRLDKRQLNQLYLQPVQKLSAETRHRIEALEGEVEKIQSQLAQHVAGLGQARRALGVRLEQVQTTIPNEGVLIEYLRYEHYLGKGKWEARYGAIVLSADTSPRWITLGGAKEIEAALNRYDDRVRDTRDDDEMAAILEKLYQEVWEPIAQALPVNLKRVIISPDGQLNFLSFATLLDGDKRFMAEKYSIQYVASGRDLLRQPKPPSDNSAAIVFAAPDFNLSSSQTVADGTSKTSIGVIRGSEKTYMKDLSFPPLDGPDLERAELTKIFVEWRSETISLGGKDATKEALFRVHSPYILHLATHGFFASEDQSDTGATELQPISLRTSVFKSKFFNNPMHRSGLALAGAQTTIEAWKRDEVPPVENDGILTAEDVSTLDLQGTWLVTLSACDTGSGEARAGEGVMRLRRGFIQAGAQNLLMTLWPISDEVTVQIISDFYEAAHNIGNAPKALADVQRKWLLKLRTEKGLAQAVNLAGPFIMSSQGKP